VPPAGNQIADAIIPSSVTDQSCPESPAKRRRQCALRWCETPDRSTPSRRATFLAFVELPMV
jgi:hypothetical protein